MPTMAGYRKQRRRDEATILRLMRQCLLIRPKQEPNTLHGKSKQIFGALKMLIHFVYATLKIQYRQWRFFVTHLGSPIG